MGWEEDRVSSGRDDVEQGSLNSITYLEKSLYNKEEPPEPQKQQNGGGSSSPSSNSVAPLGCNSIEKNFA